MTNTIPEDVTELERWAAESWGIAKLEVSYEMTSADTADTKVTLTPWSSYADEPLKPRKMSDTNFRKLFTLSLDHNTIARPKDEVVRKVKARKDYEKAHSKELAEYKRLKEKFG